MTKYREILRLKSLGFSERNIAQSCGVSRNTVAKVLKKAAEINLSWPLDFDMTDSALEELMFPKDKSATNNLNFLKFSHSNSFFIVLHSVSFTFSCKNAIISS